MNHLKYAVLCLASFVAASARSSSTMGRVAVAEVSAQLPGLSGLPNFSCHALMGSGASRKPNEPGSTGPDLDSADIPILPAADAEPSKDGSEGCAGCSIPDAEDRAITVQQLQELVKHIEAQIKKEVWVAPGAVKPVKLKAKSVNLYDVVARLVKPATEARRCSYVELVAVGPQRTRWFVSHWWGEPVFHFVSCVVKHSEQRRLGLDSTYWVCAYANNQWDLAYDLAATPAESSFRRALDVADGTLSILDDAAIAYSRVWCNYEMFVTLEKAQAGRSEIWGVPYWGPYYKGILLFGGLYSGSLYFLNPKPETLNPKP